MNAYHGPPMTLGNAAAAPARLTILLMLLAAMFGFGAVAMADEDQLNPANNWLLHQSAKDRAAMLSKVVGEGCIGRNTFYRGTMEKHTRAPGDERPEAPALPGIENDAFWSIRCTNGKNYSVEVHPDGSGKVADCLLLEKIGDHCFRKFPGQ